MQCLRIITENIDTGERIRHIRIPVMALRIALRFLPPSLVTHFYEPIDKGVVRDVKEVIPRIMDELAKLPADAESGVPGLIADIEEVRGSHDAAVDPPGDQNLPPTWRERTLIYIQ